MSTDKFAIVNGNGMFYSGRTFDHPEVWVKKVDMAFTYSKEGAFRKIALFPTTFNGCHVLQIQ